MDFSKEKKTSTIQFLIDLNEIILINHTDAITLPISVIKFSSKINFLIKNIIFFLPILREWSQEKLHFFHDVRGFMVLFSQWAPTLPISINFNERPSARTIVKGVRNVVARNVFRKDRCFRDYIKIAKIQIKKSISIYLFIYTRVRVKITLGYREC